MNEHLSRVVRALSGASVILLFALAPSSVWASPPDQTWTEDIHLHPSGPAELGMIYGAALPADDDFGSPSIDVVTLRTFAGFDRAPIEWSPSISFVSVEGFGTQIFNVGFRARYRLMGSTGDPEMAFVVGYRLMLAGGREHRMEQRLAGLIKATPAVNVAWEVGLQEHIGNQNHVEVRASAAISYGFALNFFRVSFEAFGLVPLTGDRITDFAVGAERDTPAVYLGPGLRLNFEDYLWLSGSAVTGSLIGDGAPVMVRVVVGTQF